MIKEIKQLHTRQALMTCSRNNMSYEVRKRSSKEKRDGTIKARGCADSRTKDIHKQRRYKLTYHVNI